MGTDSSGTFRPAGADAAPGDPPAFLLELSDGLRPLTDPMAIQAVAAHVLGEHLQVRRALYVEVEREPDGDHHVVKQDYCAPGCPSLVGRYRADDFGIGLIAELRGGHAVVIDDVTRDPRLTAAERQAHVLLGIGSFVVIPLLKGGQYVALFSVQHGHPHAWSAREVGLVEETAERTWAAVERARSETALRESEGRYRSLFESIDEGFCVVEILFADNGHALDYRFLEVNPAFERQTGLVNAVGRTMRELTAIHEQHWFDIYGRVALTGRPARFELPVRRLGERWYDVYAFPVGDRGQQRVAILFNDISERHRAEQTLRDSERRQAYLLALSDALRPLAGPEEIKGTACRVLGAHLRASRVLYTDTDREGFATIGPQYTDEVPRIQGRYRSESFAADLLERYRAGKTIQHPDVLADPALSEGEKDAHRAIQVAAWVVVPLVKQGEPLARLIVHHSVARDWTPEEIALIEETAERTWAAVERAQAEQALRESEARLQLVQAAGGIGTFDYDLQQDRAVCSPEYYALFGLPPGYPITRRTWHAAIHPEDQGRALATLDRAITERTAFDYEYRIIRADTGEVRWMAGRAAVIFDAENRPWRYVGGNIDITGRKLAEESLRHANEQKNEFLAMLGHELRNPLAAIKGGMQLLQSDRARPESRAGAVPIVVEQVAHMERLIDDVLDLARIERGKLQVRPERVTLQRIVGRAVEIVKELARAKAADVRCALAPEPIALDADPVRLAQVLVNLLTNALKFSVHGGRVEVRVAREPHMAAVHVRDYGAGISADLLPQIFERFVQSKRSLQIPEGGLGLGLTVARQLVEEHGGTLEAFSEGEGKGSELVLRLPLPE